MASTDNDAGDAFVRHDRATSAWGRIAAFARYGKGRGHPAQLTLADCLSYACAKRHATLLLYKGCDFSRTDLT